MVTIPRVVLREIGVQGLQVKGLVMISIGDKDRLLSLFFCGTGVRGFSRGSSG